MPFFQHNKGVLPTPSPQPFLCSSPVLSLQPWCRVEFSHVKMVWFRPRVKLKTSLTLSAMNCLWRSSISFSTAFLCSSCFILRFWAFICSIRSSSANLACICCLKASSSSCTARCATFFKANCSSYICLKSRRCLILVSISAYEENSVRCCILKIVWKNSSSANLISQRRKWQWLSLST